MVASLHTSSLQGATRSTLAIAMETGWKPDGSRMEAGWRPDGFAISHDETAPADRCEQVRGGGACLGSTGRRGQVVRSKHQALFARARYFPGFCLRIAVFTLSVK